jgi:hypothetical protein
LAREVQEAMKGERKATDFIQGQNLKREAPRMKEAF